MSGNLCQELIFEIFSRLPPKSLVRFRLLSKSLRSCIASPDFIRIYTFPSPQKVLLIIRHYVDNKSGPGNFYTLHSEDQLPLCPKRAYIGVKAVEFPYSTYCECAGSCDGVLCLFDREESRISLWNPTIRHELTLPDCPGRYVSRCHGSCPCPQCRVGSGIVPDPIGLGFGFDPITDDYKIVSLPRYGGSGASSYVYTVKTRAWCAIASPTPSFYTARSRGCFVNGALYWVVEYISTGSNEDDRFYILSFNLSTHVFDMIVLPEPRWETKQLTTIQGSLAVVYSKDGDNRVFVMREYNNTASWSLVFISRTNQVRGQLQRVLPPMTNGGLFFHTSSEGFQVYDPKKRTRSRLQNLDADSIIIDMETCVESLQLFDMEKLSILEEKEEKPNN